MKKPKKWLHPKKKYLKTEDKKMTKEDLKEYSTLLFDFDGTLVDSMPSYSRVMTKLLDDLGISYGPDLISTITPLGTVGTARYYIEEMGVPMTVDEILQRMMKDLLFAYLYEIPAKDGVVDALRHLKEQGKSLHILTASPHISLDPCLKRVGIFDLFDHIWSCDDFDLSKSDTTLFLKVAEKLCEKPENILFFDDNLGAIKTAKKAGFPVCGVEDASASGEREEIKEISDFYLESFSSLAK